MSHTPVQARNPTQGCYVSYELTQPLHLPPGGEQGISDSNRRLRFWRPPCWAANTNPLGSPAAEAPRVRGASTVAVSAAG